MSGRSKIEALWESDHEQSWLDALDAYWDFPPEQGRLEREMNFLNTQCVRRLDPERWYSFLFDKYFPWKYTAKNRLATTRAHLKRHREDRGLDDLVRIQNELFSFDPRDVARGLEIAQQIGGLGPAGASGLLALIFPDTFATADQFVVRSLREIRGLPEAEELQAMNPESLSDSNAGLIIGIANRKAMSLNQRLRTCFWTPRKIDMVLWSSRE